MKEKKHSALSGESEASGTRTPMSSISASQHYPRYPEPILSSNSPKDHTAVPPPQSMAGSAPYLQLNGNSRTRSPADGASKSARSSTSPTAQLGRKPSPRHGDRLSSLPIDSRLDPLSSSRQGSFAEPRRSSRHDPEKGSRTPYPVSNGPHQNHAFSSYISEEEELIEEHTIWILVSWSRNCSGTALTGVKHQVYLCFFSPIVATIISVFALLTSFCLLLLSPFLYFCKSCRPLKQRFYTFLTPPIHFQLGLVFSRSESDYGGIKSENYGAGTIGKVLTLVVIHTFSPVYAAGIAVTAWVAAGFWATALILGNPDGRDGKDDGKAVVLGVRRLWERWLRRGLR
ncbi:MAG: hypothetical protein Q9216_002954 [Gyalolechia sp. 2 TL-2023]